MKAIGPIPLPVDINGTLKLKPVMEINGKFTVQGYQRGYRWGEEEVLQLLDDITASQGRDYCLQPVVVKRISDDNWELIDGQQRLTTLFLLVRALGETPPWTMDYKTRPGSTDFLRQPSAAHADENIDFHHIFAAHETIIKRLDDPHNSLDREAMLEALKKRVQVIWYEAADLDPVALFTRLNSGRIQLDDAELFKALLLSRLLPRAGCASDDEHLRVNEVAVHWDAIERDLRGRELWAFLAADRKCATHISLLLEIVSGVPVRDAAGSFRVFHALRKKVEKRTAHKVWAEVATLHERALGWYTKLEQFHRIGFLIAQASGEARDKVLREVASAAASKTHRAFDTWLTDQIRDKLKIADTKLESLRYENRADVQRLLLLMNVETMGQMNVETKGQQPIREARYPFADHHVADWSVEHIHAQQAPELNTLEQWNLWIGEHERAVKVGDDTDERAEKRAELLDSIKQWRNSVSSSSPLGEVFKDLARKILDFLAEPGDEASDDEMHGLGNLALLSRAENARLSNRAFGVKRRKIICQDRKGAYIPICTRNVFLKYYSDDEVPQLQYWGASDRKAYLKQIENVVGKYLTREIRS
jgi:hypothetical protein